METQKISVKLSGLSDIMFDPFIDHSKEERPPEQKLYLYGENKLVLPAENIIAFLWGESPQGCARKFEGKAGKNYTSIGLGHVNVDPVIIPFTDNGKEIKFTGFDNGKLWIHEGSPRTKQGTLSIKQPRKKRPVLTLPWELSFTISYIKNNLIDDNKLYNWFVAGGLQIALGTYRPRFGRFEVSEWEAT